MYTRPLSKYRILEKYKLLLLLEGWKCHSLLTYSHDIKRVLRRIEGFLSQLASLSTQPLPRELIYFFTVVQAELKGHGL